MALLFAPYFRAADQLNAPIPGAFLSFYSTQTSAPQPIYADFLLTIPLQNPQQADSNGIFPAIWLDDALPPYKVVLQYPDVNNPSIPGAIVAGPNGTLDPYNSTISANALLPLVNPQTAREASVSVVPTNYHYPQGWVRRYGAVLDGVTDDSAAMIQAAKVGSRLVIDGSMALSSTALSVLPNSAIPLISGTTIQGTAGAEMKITGTTACNVFYSTDQSNIEFMDVFCQGNSQGTIATGYFWYIKGTASATAESTNLKFIRGGLTNFAGSYWIYIDNTAAVTFPISGFTCDGSRFLSKAGNCQTAALTDITRTASVFGFSGSDSVTGLFTVKDCSVRNCYADGRYIKNFLYFWSGTFRCKAYNNTLINFGADASIIDDVGTYALAVYDHAHGLGLLGDEIEFCDNTIDVVKDCGIYSAGVNRLTVSGNRVSGQTSIANGTIPKGGIALNGVNLLFASGNSFNNCAIGFSLTQAPGTTHRANIRDTDIQAIPASGVGMWISGTSAGNANSIIIDGVTCDTAAASTKGIHLVFTATVGCDNISIQNFDISGCGNGIDLFAPDSSVPAMGNVRIGNGKFRKITGNNLQWVNSTNTAQRAVFENLSFMDMIAGAIGLYVQGSVGLTVRNIAFHDMTSGATFCWYGSGSQGRVSNVQFNTVATTNRYDSGANQLGANTPGWTGNDNDFVQDLNPNELGSASSKYLRIGWMWDRVAAAWKEVRCLTGN